MSDAVVHLLANRRLHQATARVLDSVAAELDAVRIRTGGGPAGMSGLPGERDDFDQELRNATAAGAYQVSMRTGATIRQRSLSEFLN
jgi:hypothetical protein